MSTIRTLLLASLAVAGLTTTVLAGGKLEIRQVLPVGDERAALDAPPVTASAVARGTADTVLFGGEGVDGLAFDGGIWDFEDGTLQGWSSRDLTDVGQADPPGDPSVGGDTYFRRITAADFSGATTIPVMNGVGSLWAGANDEEAAAGCWPGGLGYDNGWGVSARKTFLYGGSSTVTIQFDYFTDCETQFDYTYVYTDVAGVRSPPLNGSAWSTPEGWGYSGANEEGTAIGSPTSPATDIIVIDVSLLPPGAGEPFQIIFNFDSDPLYSDGLDSFSGFLNSYFGPFGMDDFVINGVGLSDADDFEIDAEGWEFDTDPAIGTYLQVVALGDLDPIPDPCVCPITQDPDNDYVMIASDWDGSISGGFPHPQKQHELIGSNPAYIDGPDDDRPVYLIEWDVWEDLPVSNGVGYRALMDYWPWTCPETDQVGWTIEPAGDGGYIFQTLGGSRCATLRVDNSEFMTSAHANGVDSLRIVFELLGDCDDFGTADCTGPDQTNQSPYWDNITFALAGDAIDAPQLSLELLYQDAYPAENSLLPTAACDVYSFYDNNRADGDQTNANMGDSATVISESGLAPGPTPQVFMNFRLYPGPAMTSDGVNEVLVPNGGAAGGAGDARVDPTFLEVEVIETTTSGVYATYRVSDGLKVIPDGVLTPGSSVEYFFSSRYMGMLDTRVVPDTTGGFFLEFDLLPGIISGGSTAPAGDEPFLSSCVLYVDAYNVGAQEPIQDEGLRTILGTSTDPDGVVHDNWDRYDYLAANANIPAPMARETSGDNGMTKYQSLIYRTVLYNTGTNRVEGLRNGDANLLTSWLAVARPGGSDFVRGLWLSGNGIASILDRPARPFNQALLNQFCGAFLFGTPYREVAFPADSSFCVRLDADPGSDVTPPGTSYGLRGNGCPILLGFDVLGVTGDGAGDLIYVDQDAGEIQTPFAAVSNEQAPASIGYRTVVDAFSLHFLRQVPPGWIGDGDPESVPGDGEPCSDYAILTRMQDVFQFMEVPGDVMKPFDHIIVGADDVSTPIARTVLYQNAPNPFNPRTRVRFAVGTEAFVTLGVYDVSGRLVRTLVSGVHPVGAYTAEWDGLTDDGERISSGVYWARLTTSAGFSAATKMVVLK